MKRMKSDEELDRLGFEVVWQEHRPVAPRFEMITMAGISGIVIAVDTGRGVSEVAIIDRRDGHRELGRAVCHPDDEFDSQLGFVIAYKRAYRKMFSNGR